MSAAPRHGAVVSQDRTASGRLPRRRWTPGDFPFRLELAPAGLVLGLDAQGMSATFPLIVPIQSTHLSLTTRAHARDVLALRPRLDATVLDRLTDDDIVAIDQSGLQVVRPSLSQREYSLLSNPGRP